MCNVGFEEFLDLVRELLQAKGVPRAVIEWFINEAVEDVRTIYEEKAKINPLEALGEVRFYFSKSYILEKFNLVGVVFLRVSGVEVRYASAPLVYALSAFSNWIRDESEHGWIVENKLVDIRPGKTHIVLDPATSLQDFVVALRGLTIALTSVPALIYTSDIENKRTTYYFYPKCELFEEIPQP